MRVIDIGNGKPDAFVVGLLHGNEPCGKTSIENIIKKEKYPEGLNIRFIMANEKAFSEDKRYIDEDLNRSFPGDESSENHEINLAYELTEQLEKNKPILTIHSSVSTPKSFGIIRTLTPTTESIIDSLDTNLIVKNKKFHSGSMISEYGKNCLELECGRQKAKETEKTAEKEILNFLKGIFNKNDKKEYKIYKLEEKVEGSQYNFLGENFSLIKKGEIFAEKESDKKIAKENFYPVFMAKGGYDGIIGYKATRIN